MKVDKSDKAIDNMSYKKDKEDKQKDNGIMMAGKVTSFDFKNFSKYYDNVYKKGVYAVLSSFLMQISGFQTSGPVSRDIFTRRTRICGQKMHILQPGPKI